MRSGIELRQFLNVRTYFFLSKENRLFLLLFYFVNAEGCVLLVHL